MAITKKYKRKIVVGDASYYWWIKKDEDALWVDCEYSLNIISSDAKFAVQYLINQKGKNNFIASIGPRVESHWPYSGCWQRVVCPKWDDSPAIKPSIVRQIILWCLSAKETVPVNYRGEILTAGVTG